MRLPLLFWRVLIAAGLALHFTTAGAQLAAGKDYSLVRPPQPTDSGAKVEVIEFFFYGCPHCNNLVPHLEAWLKRKPADVDFKRVPAIFQDSWTPLARTYYALDAMNLTDKLHVELFAAIHRQKTRLDDANAIFNWVAGKGVDRKKFEAAYNSFGVNGRVKRSMDLTRKFDIPGTPALVVDGKYLTAPGMALKSDRSIDYDRFFQIIDGLIAEARKTKGSK